MAIRRLLNTNTSPGFRRCVSVGAGCKRKKHRVYVRLWRVCVRFGHSPEGGQPRRYIRRHIRRCVCVLARGAFTFDIVIRRLLIRKTSNSPSFRRGFDGGAAWGGDWYKKGYTKACLRYSEGLVYVRFGYSSEVQHEHIARFQAPRQRGRGLTKQKGALALARYLL